MKQQANPWAYLLGAYIHAVHVESEAQSAMRFDTGYCGRDKVYVGTDADCCSETWFADVVGAEHLIGGYVRGIELLELPQPSDERSRQERDEAYGVRLTTNTGHCEIVYRNSSNGYYGGSAEVMSEEEGGQLGWTPITGDWSA